MTDLAQINAELERRLQASVAERDELLRQQTATADVLRIISRSAFDLQAVLDALVQSAAQLTDAAYCFIFRREADKYRLASSHGFSPEYRAWMQPQVIEPGRHTLVGRTALEARTVHLPDVLADPDYTWGESIRRGGFRTMLGIPLLREGVPIGVIAACRPVALPFTEKQISLITTFADQAVIAIENARLFDEVQAKTRDLSESLQQQTATADVLKVISRSAFDLDAVMNTLTRSAADLCSAEVSTLQLCDGDLLVVRGLASANKAQEAFLRENPIAINAQSYSGRAILTGSVTNIGDVELDQTSAVLQRFRTALGYKALLHVPLMRDGRAIGLFSLTRHRVGEFSEREVELVQTFADQAVIAIENVRLLDEVQAKTRDLEQSLDDLRTAQDRLVQTEKLASLGQLTAGIAHEIKNPLNFVNNFAALSAELTEELNETLASASLDQKMRGDVDELTGMLKSNLEKVVQHGKRADSIVKNMLQHSREGSGEQRAADINALVEESLNLAYHGARAEKSGFNITLQRKFDGGAGSVELYPQEMTRAFLNVISNGFYAATRRKSESGEAGFEPTVLATTRDLGGSVEIRIRDNGTGIPAEVKEKIFNPFFTTKPAGEGTGLGLSMTHDIIVKQHGGRIDVASEPGEFTEFIIVLPRVSASGSNPE